jgi:hypothetical protein
VTGTALLEQAERFLLLIEPPKEPAEPREAELF